MTCKNFATPIVQRRSQQRSKRKKNVLTDLPNGNADDIETMPEDEGLLLLKSRCFLKKFAKKIENWQIGDRAWELLRRTPFGKLIKYILQLDLNIEIVDALLDFWDEEHCGFFIGEIIIPFTVDDIALITGLPNRGQKVVGQRVGLKCDARFNRIYLSLTNIERNLDNILRSRNNPNHEDEKFFIQQMILYLFGSVLFPSSSRVVPIYMSDYVKNIDLLGSYNWAEALHSRFVKEINLKSKVVKERNEGKEVVVGYMNGLSSIINAWFFEHVDFGEDSKSSNPEIRPRMLKWVKICKFWRRKPFLERLHNIRVDKVCYQLLPKNDEFELISLHSVVHIPAQPVEFDDAVRDDSSLVGNLEVVGSDIRARYAGTEQSGREAEKGKLETIVEKGNSSKIANLRQGVFEQNAQISILERNIVNLETLAASKGSEIKGRNDRTNKMVCEQVGHDLIETIHESCNEGDNCHRVEYIGPSKLNSITRSGKHGSHNYKRRKISKSTIANAHLILKRKDNAIDQASIPSVKNSTKFERKNHKILVNLDDYRGSTMKKEAKATSLNYIGRSLLTENIRKYLDAFCIKPMQSDDIVFFGWDICIRRHSMVEYLLGGYTREEIIDAYALILYKGVKKSGKNFASFLYVPPMFLGLYQKKLGSYKSFLNGVDMKSLGMVKLLFLPCHISTTNHWLLLVCDMKMRKWIGYDSLYDGRHREVAKEQITLLATYLFEDHGMDIRSWSLEYKRIYPQQEPGTLDCGIFVMKFIESIIRARREINFKGSISSTPMVLGSRSSIEEIFTTQVQLPSPFSLPLTYATLTAPSSPSRSMLLLVPLITCLLRISIY